MAFHVVERNYLNGWNALPIAQNSSPNYSVNVFRRSFACEVNFS